MAAAAKCWLVKSEPTCFSIHDLAAAPDQTTFWSGVRNYQARNFMRDEMRPGDRVLYYHSSADPPAVVGTAVVVKPAYPDHTAWDHRDQHYDAKSTPQNPIWYMVDIRLEQIFRAPVALNDLRSLPALKDMELLRQGSRLSVQPVRPAEYEAVLQTAARLARGDGNPTAAPAAPRAVKTQKTSVKKTAAKAQRKDSQAAAKGKSAAAKKAPRKR